MLINIIYLLTAFLGIIVVSIALVHKSYGYVNLYLGLYFFLGSLRFLTYALTEMLVIEKSRIADYAFTTLAWPLLYLYFKNILTPKDKTDLKKDFLHLILPLCLFLLISFKSFIKDELVILLTEIGVPIVIIYTLTYCYSSYRFLKNKIWKKNNSLPIANKQHIALIKWSKFLYFLFTLLLVRFLANPIINQNFNFFNTYHNFLIFGALIWIVMYSKLLVSPEFLFGYDPFQQKSNEIKKDFFVVDTTWEKKIIKEITNKKDLLLKDIMANKFLDYIENIEYLSSQTDLFFLKGFKIEDLASKMKIPKSHLFFIFKYYSEISFSDFKRTIRIKEAIRLIQSGYLNTNVIEALSQEIGFSTYSSFFKNFKEIMGMSPQDYCKKNSLLYDKN
jgi:AraC-like DNA-binding protein